MESSEIDVVDKATIWRDDSYFTKNPDVVRVAEGTFLAVFCLTDTHLAQEQADITIIESVDGGETWETKATVSESRPSEGDERWITPRLTQLSDGRLVVLCDRELGRSRVHESREPGNCLWWSDDRGETWRGPQETTIPGFEPDRVRELDDGTLVVGTGMSSKTTRHYGTFLVRSYDGGETWGDVATIANDAVHHYCEPSIVQLESGRLVCVMRDNNHSNYPSYLSFSEDRGDTWSPPVRAPFAGDRPFAEQLSDGRVLVTFRNQGGWSGTSAWIGDIEDESEHRFRVARWLGSDHSVVGSDAADPEDSDRQTDPVEISDRAVDLTDEALTLDGSEGSPRYLLYPPDSREASFTYRARLAVAGDEGDGCFTLQIARVGVVVHVSPNQISWGPYTMQSGVDGRADMDMTGWHDIRVHSEDGLVEVFVDGVSVLHRLVNVGFGYDETLRDRSFFGIAPDQSGRARLADIEYSLRNDVDEDYHWRWQPDDGHPDRYSVERWTPVHENTNPHPDHGYSSWVELPDGRILVLDYTNENAPKTKAYLNRYILEV